MSRAETLKKIVAGGVIPVVRAPSADDARRIIDALIEAGIEVIELTMTVPGALPLMEDLVKRFGDRAVIGSGTVLDSETARACILSGASFVVSPMTDEHVIRCCRTYGIPVLPGALTPTEILRAWQAGADMVKVFPCSAAGGAPYIQSIKAPLPNIELVPTGGVSLATAGDFIRAGASAIGAGADLVSLPRGGSGTSAITANARRYLDAIREARQVA